MKNAKGFTAVEAVVVAALMAIAFAIISNCCFRGNNNYIVALRSENEWIVSGCNFYRNYDNEPNGKILVINESPGGVSKQMVLYPEDFKELKNEEDVNSVFPGEDTFTFGVWDHVHERWDYSKLTKTELLKLINGE